MGLTLQGPAFSLVAGETVHQEGDSISATDTGTQMPMFIKRRYVNACQQSGKQPRWYNRAVSSTGIAASLARIQTDLPLYKPTKFVAVYGTASVILGQPIGTVNDTTNATVLGSFKLVMDAVCGVGGAQIPAYIATVMCVGEKAPSGANGAGDATIDTLVAGMATIAARYPLCTYRDMRAAMYTALEPTYNPTNLTIGPFTRPDAVAAHHNPFGRGIADSIIGGDIAITTSTSPVLGYTPYALTTLPSLNLWGLNFDSAINTDFNAGAGVADGGNVTAWRNRGYLGTAGDLITTPGTKPVFRLSATGLSAPAVEAVGATFARSAVFAAQSQPFISLLVTRPTNFTASQIIVDGTSGIQQAYIATLATTGVVEIDSGLPIDGPPAAVTKWNAIIAYYSGDRASSYVVVNGVPSQWGDEGAQTTRTQLTLFANAAGGLPGVGMITQFAEAYAPQASQLPKWQDVLGYVTARFGKTPF